ncbi:sensor histidine kinase [Actinomycetospora termitidis]|uniref:histidine kinase n=1 Tax=Actinomycetospora termitidis TaxID=3053470 RepID=A0ABT7M5J3_9PSEU|nr:HAMP domain-containing sensor histidine kinase [Actinomycetospora sp. Odt1-22]MDL5155057.1 HAMP domain-containing sensor histidine kinase [Actinomycetospora sp. Odt1-22]
MTTVPTTTGRTTTTERRGRLSARLRIVAWVLLVVLASLALVTVVTWRLSVRETDARMDAALRTEIDEFTGLTASGRDPSPGRPFGTVDAVLQTAITYNLARPNEKFLGYVDGVFRFQSRQASPVLLSADPAFTALVGPVTAPTSGTYASAAGEVRYLAVPVTLAGTPARGVLVAAYFADQERAAADDAALLMVGVGAVTALLAAGGAWFVAGRILAPVRSVARTARTITETDLSARIRVTTGRDEMGDLVTAVNAMLDRLEAGAAEQRRFVDDAGHELRTPITIVRGHLDVVDATDPDDVREALALVDDELDRMNRIVADLLVLAKAEQPAFVRPEPTDVDALVEETLAKARGLGDRHWGIVTSVGGLVQALDAQRITQALLALADNAVAHTVPADRIVLGAAMSGGVLELRVSDTGIGVADADRDRIFARFARGGGARRSEGAGLGLAVVGAIAAAHGGRVALSDGVGAGRPGESGPGATFTLVIPYRAEWS